MSHPQNTTDTPLCACGCGAHVKRQKDGRLRARYLPGHHAPSSPREYLVDPTTGCWLWQRSLKPNGYGLAYVNRRPMQAHRVIYERHRGPIPAGMVLDHIASVCRHKHCVNPWHLEAVPQAVNVQRGKRSRLTPEMVREARLLHELDGVSVAELARRFGVGAATMSNALHGGSWKQVE